jgi:3-dehydroquinate dehydratase
MENKSQFDNNMDDVLKIVNKHADEVKRKEEMEAEIAARKASRSSAKIAKKNQVRKDITMSIASVILSLAILSKVVPFVQGQINNYHSKEAFSAASVIVAHAKLLDSS